jgi:chitinase
MRETTDMKSKGTSLHNLQVYLSLGGWTFSDNNTATQPVLGDIASTQANRDDFARNVLSFLNEYGFDGIDIDWEYPGAPDRGGQERDVKNFPLLLEAINKALRTSPRKLGLTITIPSSYWYLRWFDLAAIAPHIETFNVMTYDLHGELAPSV